MARFGLRYRGAVRRIDVPLIEGCFEVFDRNTPPPHHGVFFHSNEEKARQRRDELNAACPAPCPAPEASPTRPYQPNSPTR